jgi:thymidylate kinase
MTAKLIVFEGADRVGKATQSHLLVENLKKAGFRVAKFEIPYNPASLSYKLIYFMLEHKLAKKFPTGFQFTHFVNKYLFQASTLTPALEKNDYVVIDRWKLSSLIYGNATGANVDFVQRLSNLLVFPDITIVLSRNQEMKPEDEYEADKALQMRVKLDYIEFACTDARALFVRNDDSIENCSKIIFNALSARGVIPDNLSYEKLF